MGTLEVALPEAQVGATANTGACRRLGKKMVEFFRPPPPKQQRLLPPSVLYALSHRGAKLNSGEVESLQRSGFPRAAFYLALKSAEDHDGVQRGLLQTLADRRFDYSSLGVEDISPALRRMDDRGTKVGGEKLGQFSRHGFDQSVATFDRTLNGTYAEQPRSSLFMVANYPFIAMDVLADHSLGTGNSLGILKPERLGQTAMPVGFMIEPGENGLTVRDLEPDFDRPPGSVVFDDVLRSGQVKGQVMEFWGDEPPTFVTGVTVKSPI